MTDVRNAPSLQSLQSWMRWTLTLPDGPCAVVHGKGRVPLPKGWTRGPEPARQLHVIGATETLGQEERLAIYGAGYFLRIIGCLAENFVCVKNTVGEAAFNELARAYLVRFPSDSKCIDDIGHKMSFFLMRHPLTTKFPFLPDLAALEWTYHESFFADEMPALELNALQDRSETAWAAARLELDSSVKLLALDWNVEDLWRADGRWKGKRPAVKRVTTNLLIHRRYDAQVRVTPLAPAARALLSGLKAGRPLARALSAAARSDRKFRPDHAMTWLRTWSEAGVIRAVRFS